MTTYQTADQMREYAIAMDTEHVASQQHLSGIIKEQAAEIERLKDEGAVYKRAFEFVGTEWKAEVDALKAEIERFEPFLKEGETPFERFTRERKDGDALLKVYGHALKANADLVCAIDRIHDVLNGVYVDDVASIVNNALTANRAALEKQE